MVSKLKAKEVEELTTLIDKYPVVGLLEMKSMPSAQLQDMRRQLREQALIKMFRKNAVIRAIEKSKKKNILSLKEKIGEIPAFIFSETDPFRLSKILQKSRSPAAAKVGDVLTKEVEIKSGPTSIAAGPAIGQLQKLGLKTTVKDGKISIEAGKVIATGTTVTKDLVNIFTLMDIKPMMIGLNMVAAHEDGMVYDQKALSIDEEYVIKSLEQAIADAFTLSIALKIPTKENISYLLSSAVSDAEALLSAKKMKEEEKGEKIEEKGEIEEVEEGKKKEKVVLEKKTEEKAKKREKKEIKEEKKSLKKLKKDKRKGG